MRLTAEPVPLQNVCWVHGKARLGILGFPETASLRHCILSAVWWHYFSLLHIPSNTHFTGPSSQQVVDSFIDSSLKSSTQFCEVLGLPLPISILRQGDICPVVKCRGDESSFLLFILFASLSGSSGALQWTSPYPPSVGRQFQVWLYPLVVFPSRFKLFFIILFC